MQYAVLIEREPGAPTIAAYSPGVNLTVIRDASASDDELLAAFQEDLDFFLQTLKEEGLPVPPPAPPVRGSRLVTVAE
jgi:hypothetical protein